MHSFIRHRISEEGRMKLLFCACSKIEMMGVLRKHCISFDQ